jgi:3-oxoacyl-[acyl-carrier-protein] synthase-3
LLVPHQANKRIIDATANRMNLEESKVLMNIEKYGHLRPYLWFNDFEHLFKKDTIILAAFGRDSLGIYLFKMGIRQTINLN